MWYVVRVVKGSKHYEPESQIGNLVLISDTTDMTISGRSMGDGFRFEARKGTETFVVKDFAASQPAGTIASKFAALAHKMGALVISET
ncbi:MAG: hypothetical protein KF788_11765 [Piscinibacter sp.]|nr:hypothetical protein [Piscinibacter sp.]